MNPTSFMHIFKKKQNVCKVRLLWVILILFLGLSFRDTSKALSPFVKKRSHVSIWKWWLQHHYNPQKIYCVKEKGFLNLSVMKP